MEWFVWEGTFGGQAVQPSCMGKDIFHQIGEKMSLSVHNYFLQPQIYIQLQSPYFVLLGPI